MRGEKKNYGKGIKITLSKFEIPYTKKVLQGSEKTACGVGFHSVLFRLTTRNNKKKSSRETRNPFEDFFESLSSETMRREEKFE